MKSESEIREWIDELAEEQREKERQRSRRREREQRTLEEMRQRRIEKLRERGEENGGDPDLLLTLFEFDEELIEEDEEGIDERRQEVIDQGEDVDLPNETSAFIDGATFGSDSSHPHHPYYVEIRGREGELEYSERHPESINVRVNSSHNGRGVDKKTVNWWFSFTPDETKVWDFIIVLPYRGFRFQWSVTPPQAESTLALWEEYRVHQHNAGPREGKVRLFELHDDIYELTRYDRTLSGHYSHVLSRGESALLHVHQGFEVSAYGGALRSELNFGSGAGNNLPAPYFFVK